MMVTSRHQYTTMVGLGSLLVLVAALQLITSQENEQGLPGGPPPEWANKCAGPPPGVNHPQSCCQAKPVFTQQEMAACGFQNMEEEYQQGPPDCSKQICLLKSKNCLKEDNTVDRDAVARFLRNWATEDKWKPVVDEAIGYCLNYSGIPGPPQICEANRMMFCIGGRMFNDCQDWQDTDDCRRLKQHIEECRALKYPPPK